MGLGARNFILVPVLLFVAYVALKLILFSVPVFLSVSWLVLLRKKA